MFPSPEELQRRLAEAEIALFLQRGAVDDELLATAWYLHGVGTARESLQIYPVERQLRANQVAAHIFDLALSAGIASEVVRREMTFAAQVSYLRGDLDPNALALYRRLPRSEPRLRDEPGAVSLDVGSAVLALDRRRLFGGRLRALRREASQLARIVGVTDLIETPYGSCGAGDRGVQQPHRPSHLQPAGPARAGAAALRRGNRPAVRAVRPRLPMGRGAPARHRRRPRHHVGLGAPAAVGAAGRGEGDDPGRPAGAVPLAAAARAAQRHAEPARSRGAAARPVVPHVRGQDVDGAVHRGGARGERRRLGLRRRPHPQPRS